MTTYHTLLNASDPEARTVRSLVELQRIVNMFVGKQHVRMISLGAQEAYNKERCQDPSAPRSCMKICSTSNESLANSVLADRSQKQLSFACEEWTPSSKTNTQIKILACVCALPALVKCSSLMKDFQEEFPNKCFTHLTSPVQMQPL